MRQNIPSIAIISEDEKIVLDNVIAVSIENKGASTILINFNGGFGSGADILPGEETSWQCEPEGSFKGQSLFITFSDAGNKRVFIKTITRGAEIIEQC